MNAARAVTTVVLALSLAIVGSPRAAAAEPGVARSTTPAGPVAPRSRSRIWVMPISVEGELDANVQSELEAKLRSGLDDSAIVVREPDPSRAPCTELRCAIERARALAADHVVVTEFVVDDKIYGLRIAAIDVRDNSVVAEVRESCEVCGAAEVAELLQRQAAVLGERLAVLAPTPAVLAVRSDPAGAAIVLDGAAVGRAPLRLELEAGPHRLRASLPEHASIEHRMVAVAGVQETWSFVLPRLPPPARARRGRAAAWAVLGIGIGALVPGVVFLALDGTPYRARCSGSQRDADGDCRFVYHSTVHGAVLTAAGLALLATGIVLVATARRKRARAGTNVATRWMGERDVILDPAFEPRPHLGDRARDLGRGLH